MNVGRTFHFDAAHHLPDYKGKCEAPHGHTYRLDVVIEGKQKSDGMVLDFAELKRAVNELVLDKLDHKDLNDIFKTPSAENIAQWIFNALKKRLNVVSVKLWEGQNNWVEVDG